MSLEGNARVGLDVEEGFVSLMVRAEAVHCLAEVRVSHVEVGAAAEGRGALTSPTVH